MLLKYYPFIIFLSQKLAFGFFDIGNTFNRLTEELNLGNLGEVRRNNGEPPLWIEQKLDHFDPIEVRTWKMRYFRRLDLWKPNGPIFIYLGGEGPTSIDYALTGTAHELAEETGGAIYVTEHRYYGLSLPLNITEDVNDFKFLSSRQAMADAAALIKTIKLQPSKKNSKVVVIGGSYSGNLAAWMRLLYPELVDAAVASSAPVLAKVDFYEYLEKVNDDYRKYGTQNCLDKITQIFKRFDELMQTSEGIQQLKEEQNICLACDMTIKENKQIFLMEKIDIFMENAQYGDPNVIRDHCKRLENALDPKFLNRQSRISLWYERDQCHDYDFNLLIKQYQKYSYKNEILPWIYQTCTEFGYFQTMSSKSQPFTHYVDVDFYVKICNSLFGDDFNKDKVYEEIEKTNDFYGGLKPNVTNVVFINGELDPWSRLGVLKNLSDDAPAVIVPRSSHCKDLFSNESIDVIKARQHIKYLIKKWIGADP